RRLAGRASGVPGDLRRGSRADTLLSSHRLPRPFRRFHQLPEQPVTNAFHDLSLGCEAPNLQQLRASVVTGNLQSVGSTTHQHVRHRSWFRLENRARLFRSGDRFAARAAQKSSERDSLSFETHDAAEMRLLGSMTQRFDQLTGRLVTLAPCAEAAVDDFLEV